MRKDFFIFRHGETDYNAKGIQQGQSIDAELNETGIRQAKHLAEALTGTGIEAVYSSPMKRAVKTGQIVADKLGIKLYFADSLKEGNAGIFEGLTPAEKAENYPQELELWNSFESSSWDFRLPGGESKREIADRLSASLKNLIDTPYRKIAISTHSRILRMFLWKLGCPRPTFSNASFCHIVYEKGNWTVCE